MTIYAVIDVDQDYDYVVGAACLASFSTEPEANGLIKRMRDESAAAWKFRLEYIDKFVEAVEVPEPKTHQEWQDWVMKYPVYANHTHPKNFKEHLRDSLRKGHGLTLEEYAPPPRGGNCNNLFVVTIEVPT